MLYYYTTAMITSSGLSVDVIRLPWMKRVMDGCFDKIDKKIVRIAPLSNILIVHDISLVGTDEGTVHGIDLIQRQGGGGYKYALANASHSHGTGASGYILFSGK